MRRSRDEEFEHVSCTVGSVELFSSAARSQKARKVDAIGPWLSCRDGARDRTCSIGVVVVVLRVA